MLIQWNFQVFPVLVVFAEFEFGILLPKAANNRAMATNADQRLQLVLLQPAQLLRRLRLRW